MPVLLLDHSGQVILPESNNKSLPLPEPLLKDPYTPYVNGAFTLIGITDAEPMFLCFSGNSPEVESCARLCAQLVNMLLKDEKSAVNTDNGIRMILEGEIDPSEVEAIAAEQRIPMNAERTVLYAMFTENYSENIVSLIRDLFAENDEDFVCEVGRHAIAIVKLINEDLEGEEIEQYAQALQNTFLTETGATALIGIGESKDSLGKLHESLSEARKAISIGRTFHPKAQIFNYAKMVLERFLAGIPEETAAVFHQTLFNRKTSKLFSEEMLNTIETFFDNSLNLSETARQLYIHRNTLVYRLDKIQKIVGLDLRAFDDAVTFKLLMLMGKQKKDKKTRT
ncbi:MAG: helix-turn-helix domain-containing protein [Clostridia bacterium]|nr:helix-turn-helix domain-containing protein [Clostridia bacterium]